eukprot:IDg19754t1
MCLLSMQSSSCARIDAHILPLPPPLRRRSAARDEVRRAGRRLTRTDGDVRDADGPRHPPLRSRPRQWHCRPRCRALCDFLLNSLEICRLQLLALPLCLCAKLYYIIASGDCSKKIMMPRKALLYVQCSSMSLCLLFLAVQLL